MDLDLVEINADNKKLNKKNNHDIFLTLAPKSLNKLQKTEAITDEGTLKYCTVADIA